MAVTHQRASYIQVLLLVLKEMTSLLQPVLII